MQVEAGHPEFDHERFVVVVDAARFLGPWRRATPPQVTYDEDGAPCLGWRQKKFAWAETAFERSMEKNDDLQKSARRNRANRSPKLREAKHCL